jgi:hypothetical protein
MKAVDLGHVGDDAPGHLHRHERIGIGIGLEREPEVLAPFERVGDRVVEGAGGRSERRAGDERAQSAERQGTARDVHRGDPFGTERR